MKESSMELIDTHTHLHFKEFDADREAVIERARLAGVSQIITLGTDLQSSMQSLDIAAEYPYIFAAAGIHPSEAHLAVEADCEQIKYHAWNEPKIVAIGEIGLDFYWDKTHYQEQYDIFHRMLEIAGELDMPVVIHNRAAQREMEWFFQEEGFTHLQGVMHCFAGDHIDARFYLELGLHISFTANITHPGFRAHQVVRSVPLDRLLLETDSPFIPPASFRNQRNEPARVIQVAEKLAEIYEKPIEEIARITSQNARRLFGLPE